MYYEKKGGGGTNNEKVSALFFQTPHHRTNYESLLDKEAKRRFQAIVGGAMYWSKLARCDISYAAIQTANEMSRPSKVHLVGINSGLKSTSVPKQGGEL